MKALAARKDLKKSYTQQQKIEEKPEEMPASTPKAEKSVHSHLAAEAKAALAASEDFSSVQLKKDNKVVPNAEFVPYKGQGETMLLQIKGRRMCQTRLVEPSPSSVNSGDAYVALNGSEVVVWQGQYANVIERSRSAEIGSMIVQKKDMGCKKARRVTLVEEEKVTSANMGNKLFWRMLGSDQPLKAKPAGPPEEDEEYEASINDMNLVWEVNDKTSELVPVEKFWGHPLKYDVLDDQNKVLVFNFNNHECYVYNGRNAPFYTRRVGLKLAKDMWDEQSATRPKWTIFGRQNQNMETICFREKFLNWPDKSRLIKAEPEGKNKNKKKVNANDDHLKLSTDVENNFDSFAMAKWPLQEPNLELEGTFLGRGRSYYDAAERRQYEIETLSIQFWHVTDLDIAELPEREFGQFYSENTFVIRWKYKVSLTGKTLKGAPSKHVAVGRERWAYFFWHGSDSKAADQGISALMTVELDEEKGPQIRVEQGQEDATFLNLWKGKMAIHKGRRGQSRSSQNRLYFVKGECPEEACAVQVTCGADSLRSRGCFILITQASKAFIWQGNGLPEHKKAVAQALQERWNDLKSLSVSVEREGSESEDFRRAVGGLDSGEFAFDLEVPSNSLRLYHMTSVSGEFHVEEVACPYLSEDVPNTLSFNQSDLYSVEQPGKQGIDFA